MIMNSYYANKRLLDTKEACNYTGLGPTKIREWGKEIGAIKHIGRRVLFDRVILDKFIDAAGEEE